jgi:putative transposase
LHDELANQGDTYCPNRVARLAKMAGIKPQIGYKRRSGHHGGKPLLAVDNTLDRQVDVQQPDRAWMTDITCIRTLEGFAYLAIVIDPYSRRMVGWAIQGLQTSGLASRALLMAVWRRKPKDRVLVQSGQGSQFTRRTCAWLDRCNRLARDRENFNQKALAVLLLSSVRLMLRNPCNPGLRPGWTRGNILRHKIVVGSFLLQLCAKWEPYSW